MTHFNPIPGLVCLCLTPLTIAAAADYLSVDAAQKAVYPEADTFQELVVTRSVEQREELLARAGPQPPHGVIRIWRATRSGLLLGYFFVDEVIGRQNLITYAVGIDKDGALRNLEIMAYRESHGGEIRNAAWRDQFNQVGDLNRLRFRTDIKNISGATLSSEHVTQGVRWLLALWQSALRTTADAG